MKGKRVVVGLSGGVDSSVAAYILKKQGYEVIGIFMKNWHDDTVTISNECPWLEDSYDAVLVSQKLNIPFQTIDLSKEYKTKVVDYMFDEYSKGRTPNPDILCNREIKFDLFLNISLSLGADFVGTGHYCQKKEIIINKKKYNRLLQGQDSKKDQSYFLCQISQEQLNKTLFPIGHMKKSEVRRIAMEAGLNTADKKDSQGLCFIGKVKLPDFLQQRLKPKKGDIVKIPETLSCYKKYKSFLMKSEKIYNAELAKPFKYKINEGKIIGAHKGAHYFTIGQRKGLALGGSKKPLFVLFTDIKNNIIYVGEGKKHPGLYRKALRVLNSQTHWLRDDMKLNKGESLKVKARIRYRQNLIDAILIQKDKYLYIFFDKLQLSITPGQFIAWYIKNEVIGSGIILE
ncbi:MAG: tRNA 2-thiouridine(34) synthase MnmA [Flavobacteriaceae bacterium]|nr:tRNA 2-thiouridine(34) synthase MnmA [Flavobacteriaceae bacterium]|tara:strand:- start:54 stop:1253 length:1200 start_codon:yes stop_codon:yes gene_type:complete